MLMNNPIPTHLLRLADVLTNRFLTMVVLGSLVLVPALAHPATTGSFTLVQPMGQFRKQHTATLLSNGKVLIAGGSPLAEASTSELYDPETQTWTNAGVLNLGRELHTATLLQDGTVLVTGGQTADQLLASTEVYDPATGMWTDAGPMNVGRELHSATLLSSGVVLVAGGFQNISSAEEFIPGIGLWTLTGSMNTPRYQHTAT
jgi:hypothetical protein